MRRPLIAGNWKMNGSAASCTALAEEVAANTPDPAAVTLLVCPPFVYLQHVGAALAGSSVCLGAQNVADREQGAFTGEVAADMLAELGCRHVLVGHSERRGLYGESDALVAARFAAAKRHGLVPILCVGETLAERDAGATWSVLARQLDAIFDALGAPAFTDAVVAYEPVWAIGTGRSAEPAQAEAAHAFVREHIAAREAASAEALAIVYGGSVKPDSAAALFACENVDGGLIGGAALQAEAFLAIAYAAAHGAGSHK